MKNILFLLFATMLVSNCCNKKENYSPQGVYISNVLDRDTLFIYSSPKFKYDKSNCNNQLLGSYDRHVFYNDTLRVHKGEIVYYIDFKYITLHHWLQYGELSEESGEVRRDLKGTYMIIGIGYDSCRNIESLWLGSGYDPEEKYIKQK